MKRALHTFFTLGSSQPKLPTFGQARAEQLDARLTKAVTERRTLSRAEAAADNPLNETYHRKGILVGSKIGRLQKAISDTKE